MSRGRTFAEKEIAVLGAAIISLRNIQLASDTWRIPATLLATGVEKSVKDTRVKIRRRISF